MKRRIFTAWLLGLVAVTVIGLHPTSGAVAASAADVVPLTPTRVLDSRTGLGVVGPVVAGSPVDVVLAGVGGVPAAGVDAVVINVTATAATAGTFVSVWPSGDTQPNTSVLNVAPNQAFANLVVAKLGDGGAVSIANGVGSVQLIGDVVGWIPSGSTVVSVTPDRVLDTRFSIGVPAAGSVGAGQSVDLDVLGVGGVPASGVDAVWLNVTATGASQPSFVTVWPNGETQPTASVLNVSSAQAVPNLVLARVGTSGRVSLYNDAGSVHLLADVVAYVETGSSVEPLTPSRIVDTRQGTGVRAGRVGAGETVTFGALDVGGVPASGVSAVIVNVTAAGPSDRSFMTVWPGGGTQPTASTLNTAPGVTVANLALVPVGIDGTVSVYNDLGDLHLLIDVVGYVAAPSSPPVDPAAEVVLWAASAGINALAYRVTFDAQSGEETSRIVREHDELWSLRGDRSMNTTTQNGFRVLNRNVEDDDHIEVITPYREPISIVRSMTESVLAGGVLTAATATVGLDVDVTDLSMVITGRAIRGGDIDGAQDRTPTLNADGLTGFEASGFVRVRVSVPMMLTVSQECPTFGGPYEVRPATGQPLGDANGCIINPVLLEPADYFFHFGNGSKVYEEVNLVQNIIFTLTAV